MFAGEFNFSVLKKAALSRFFNYTDEDYSAF